jgi:nitrate/nitrite-specific signal transduction histidine kinase
MKQTFEKEIRNTDERAHPDTGGSLLNSQKGAEILNMLKRGAEFTHELLRENEKLRYSTAKLEEQNESLKKRSENVVARTEIEGMERKLRTLTEENSKLLERFSEVEKENSDFANKYVEIEQENNMLANLYISSYQLHSSLDFNEVLRIIMEIIINLIGAEQFALFLLDEKTQVLKAVASEGVDLEDIPSFTVGETTVVGNAVKTGESYYSEDITAREPIDMAEPLVCIPMKIKERVIGTIVVYKLFQQKDCFTKLDYELFYMLAGHAATAIFSSKLYTESERRLSTIQGFIELITK